MYKYHLEMIYFELWPMNYVHFIIFPLIIIDTAIFAVRYVNIRQQLGTLNLALGPKDRDTKCNVERQK